MVRKCGKYRGIGYEVYGLVRKIMLRVILWVYR